MDSSRRLKVLTRTLEKHLPRVEQGHLLGETFLIDLTSPLGAGGQGAVFRGIHISLELPVAVKVFGAEETESEKLIARFVREARILAQINSRDVVRVWDLDLVDAAGCYYFVSEFVRGAPLNEAARSVGRPLSEPEALATCIAAARGLADMHAAGIIHRDFKPGNALWLAGTDRIKVCDLGLAKESGPDTMGLTVMGETFGSPAYMAPEQARGARDVSTPADVYSLGAILYFLLTGETPATISSLQELLASAGGGNVDELCANVRARGVSKATQNLLSEMLAKNPAARPVDASAAIAKLTAVLAKTPGNHTVDLAACFSESKIAEPLAVTLPADRGVLWRPPPALASRAPTGRYSAEELAAHSEATANKSAAQPGSETQFWENAFPSLKKEREARKSTDPEVGA